MALDVEMRRKEETSANVGREVEEGGRGGRRGREGEEEGEEGGEGGRREGEEEGEGGRGGGRGREGEEEGEGGRGGGRGREGEEGGRWNEEERIWISSTSYYMYIHVGGGTLSSSTTPSRTYFALQKCWHQRVKKIKNRVACTQRSHDVASDKKLNFSI